jgi:hypothetical protein
MAMIGHDRRFAGRGPAGGGHRGLTLDEAQRLAAYARRLQGEAIATALRRAPAVLAGVPGAVLAFVRYAAAGQAKRVPTPPAQGGRLTPC